VVLVKHSVRRGVRELTHRIGREPSDPDHLSVDRQNLTEERIVRISSLHALDEPSWYPEHEAVGGAQGVGLLAEA